MAVGSLFVVPMFGGAGAAALLVTAYGFTATVLAIVLRDQLPGERLVRELRPVAALGAALAIVWSACRMLHAPFLPCFLAGAVAYAGVAIVSGLAPLGFGRPRSERA